MDEKPKQLEIIEQKKSNRGRKPLGEKAMTAAERDKKRRVKQQHIKLQKEMIVKHPNLEQGSVEYRRAYEDLKWGTGPGRPKVNRTREQQKAYDEKRSRQKAESKKRVRERRKNGEEVKDVTFEELLKDPEKKKRYESILKVEGIDEFPEEYKDEEEEADDYDPFAILKEEPEDYDDDDEPTEEEIAEYLRSMKRKEKEKNKKVE